MTTPNRVDALRTIRAIDNCATFLSELFSYCCKRSGDLNEVEEEAYLVLSLLPVSEGDGFSSLFYQHYTLRQCAIVEHALRKLGLESLATLFEEAKAIYIRGRTDITEDEYQALEPFTLSVEQGQRFDQIGTQFIGADSEIHFMDIRACAYFRAALNTLVSQDSQASGEP